jgi:hypothetical protein
MGPGHSWFGRFVFLHQSHPTSTMIALRACGSERLPVGSSDQGERKLDSMLQGVWRPGACANVR